MFIARSYLNGVFLQPLSSKDLHNGRAVATGSGQDRRNGMLLQSEVAWIDEVHHRTQPFRLGGKEFLNMVPTGQDDGPSDTDDIGHETKEAD